MVMHAKLRPWGPGTSPNPAGRQIGSRNRLSEKFITAMHDDFVLHGREVIARVREENPTAYLQVVGRLVPREYNVKHATMVDGMPDEQLNAALDYVRNAIAARTGGGADLSAAPPDSKDKLN